MLARSVPSAVRQMRSTGKSSSCSPTIPMSLFGCRFMIRMRPSVDPVSRVSSSILTMLWMLSGCPGNRSEMFAQLPQSHRLTIPPWLPQTTVFPPFMISTESSSSSKYSERALSFRCFKLYTPSVPSPLAAKSLPRAMSTAMSAM